MPGEDGIEDIPPGIARTREVAADLGKLVDVHLVPLLVKLLQSEGPKVPEAPHVEAGVRPIPPTLQQGSGYLVRDLSSLSLLCCFLHLPDSSEPQVPETARGVALVLQKDELLAPQRSSVDSNPQLAQS